MELRNSALSELLSRNKNKQLQVNNVDCLNVDYIRSSSTCLAYSGGLESSVISMFLPSTVDFLCFHNANTYRERYFPKYSFIESILPIVAKYKLGYDTIFIGDDGGPDYTHLLELSLNFFDVHSKFLDISIISPLALLDKWKIFEIGIKHNVSFNSCMNSDLANNSLIWCGHCFKCFQISTFYRALGLSSGFEYTNNSDAQQWVKEIQQFRTDGLEHWEGDCYSFISMENSLNLKIEDLWKTKN